MNKKKLTFPFVEMYECGCGYVFPEDLGKYGCPNCEGESPVKRVEVEISEVKETVIYRGNFKLIRKIIQQNL